MKLMKSSKSTHWILQRLRMLCIVCCWLNYILSLYIYLCVCFYDSSALGGGGSVSNCVVSCPVLIRILLCSFYFYFVSSSSFPSLSSSLPPQFFRLFSFSLINFLTSTFFYTVCVSISKSFFSVFALFWMIFRKFDYCCFK